MAEGFNFEAAKLKAVPLPKSDRKALPFCIEEVDGLDVSSTLPFVQNTLNIDHSGLTNHFRGS